MAETLEKYNSRRDFTKTKEPSGKARPAAAGAAALSFVIQKHAARRLHYDLRLEHRGVLWSWAVTRGPSLDPSERRLAVHVEDHPIDYAGFEGTIPQGEYGGGSVIVWDNGSWIPEHDPAAMMKKGHIDFELKGEKLSGRWHLVRLKPRSGEKAENWLLIKSDDASASHDGSDILAKRPESIKSGLTVEAIGTAEAPVWRSNRGKTDQKSAIKKPAKKTAPENASAALSFVPPCLATLRTTPPAGPEWLHEVKFDGYRLQAHIADGRVTLFTRTGLDWTPRFGSAVPGALAALPCDSAIIDGEVVVLGSSGTSSFSALQAALSEGKTDAMVFYAFDLLHLDGADLAGEPLADRKEHLRDLLGDATEDTILRYSEHFTESGQIMLEHACRLGLEGVVSKRADAPYTSGRGHDWLKSKCTQRHEFVIAGYLPSEKSGRGLRSLVMGYYEDGALKPAGNVGTGFNAATLDDLKRKLDGIPAKGSPFKVKVPDQKRIVWAKPELVAEIEYRDITADGILRHASFQGLREDKPAAEVVEEVAESDPIETEPAQPGPKDNAPAKKMAAKRSKKTVVALVPAKTSLTISRPDKLLWPDAGITKQGLLDHYALAWERMKPYVVNRPLSLVRAPDGVGGAQRFFQKHASKGMSDAIRRQIDKEGEELLFIDSFDGLAALVQMGVVEVHIWGSTMDDVERPDQIIFDLDPDEGLGVEDVRRAALDIRARLTELDLTSVVKVSGGKGYHVVVPLKPSAEWDEVKGFAHDFARALTQAEPDRYTATLSKKARKGRIFIDYLRNGRGSTTIAPWSSRAKPQATVSVPITWEQIGTVGPADYAIGQEATLDMLRAEDPWSGFFGMGKVLKG